MARSSLWLTIIILAELGVGGWLIARRLGRPSCPRPLLESIEPVEARELSTHSRQCRTAGDWSEHAAWLLACGFAAESEACYRQAAAMAPADAGIRYDWALVLIPMGLTAELSEQLQQAVQLGVEDPGRCWYLIGRNHLQAGETEQARAAFQRDSSAASQYELARLSLRAGDAADAISRLDGILSARPGCVRPSLLRARAWEMLGRPDRAARDWAAAEQADGRLPTPWDAQRQRLAAVRRKFGVPRRRAACEQLLADGKTQQAAAGLRQALQAWWSPAAALQLADVELQLGRPRKAERLLQQALQRDGPSTDVLTRLGQVLLRSGDLKRAEQVLQRAARMAAPSQLHDTHDLLAQLYRQLGDEMKARWHAALRQHARGARSLRKGELPTAELAFAEAVRRAPQHAPSWYGLGEARRRQQDQAAAREAYRQCLEIDSEHGRARMRLKEMQ